MEIVRGITEILFKMSVIIYMIIMARSYKTIVDCINTLQKIVITQTQYTDNLRKKIENLEEELKSKKKGAKKNGTRHEIKN